jgi:hypothetical protein
MAPPAVLFSNQFQEDLKKLYDLVDYADLQRSDGFSSYG